MGGGALAEDGENVLEGCQIFSFMMELGSELSCCKCLFCISKKNKGFITENTRVQASRGANSFWAVTQNRASPRGATISSTKWASL